jgi:prepilin-type N-terminal cleavage/methylation domain-containing protein
MTSQIGLRKRSKSSFFQHKGFTLVEIIIVVLLLSVIAGLTVPSFRKTYQSIILKNAAVDLAYLMRYAQSRALVRGKDHRLMFSPEFKSYWLTELSDEESQQQDAAYQAISGRMAAETYFPKEVTVDSEETVIDFEEDGSMTKASIEVCLKDKCLEVSTAQERGKVVVARK